MLSGIGPATADEYTTEELLEWVRDQRKELAFYLEQERTIKKVENVIKERVRLHVEETGEIGDVVQIDGATVHVKPGVTKQKWDEVILASLVPMYPDIKQARSEVQYAPRVWVKID